MEGFGLAQWHRARRGAVTPKILNSGEQDSNLCAHVGTDNPLFKKLVGSLGILFCYNGQWMIASRGFFSIPQ